MMWKRSHWKRKMRQILHVCYLVLADVKSLIHYCWMYYFLNGIRTAQNIFIFLFQQKNGNIFWYMRPSIQVSNSVKYIKFTQSQMYERGSFKKNFIWERKRLITEGKKGNIQTIYLQHKTRDHLQGCKL